MIIYLLFSSSSTLVGLDLEKNERLTQKSREKEQENSFRQILVLKKINLEIQREGTRKQFQIDTGFKEVKFELLTFPFMSFSI